MASEVTEDAEEIAWYTVDEASKTITLAASGNEINFVYTINTYTIIFVDEDGTVLQSGNVAYGETPVYSGDTPTKTAEWYEYTHSGWTPDVEPVTTWATYTAKYSAACSTWYHDQSLEPSTNNNEAIVGVDFGRVSPNVTSEDTNNEAVNEWWNTATALVCVPNTKTVDCTEGKDAHGTYTVTWVEITWNGKAWSEPTMCELSCNRWYHLNANGACEEDSNWWWGGWGGTSWGGQPDDCPNGDLSWDTHDGTCDAPEQPGWNSGWWDDEEEIELGWQVSDKCSVEWSNRSEEEKAAYLYACENDITTIRDIEKARLGDFLTRAEMAKMISVFATKELWMKPNTSKDCSNFADSIASYNQEMKDYMVMACQLEIMGIHTTNYEAIPDFMPSKHVSRAEFGTVLSRILWWNAYEGTNDNYYVNHLNALKENNIITKIDPTITEYRAWVFLMLYRSVEAIKISRSNANQTVEEQVNEELQEEWKAETGFVAEVETWSVETWAIAETWTTADTTTWAVAETETGSVVEAQTWDTVSLTGDDISKEVSAETWTVAETETWSTSD